MFKLSVILSFVFLIVSGFGHFDHAFAQEVQLKNTISEQAQIFDQAKQTIDIVHLHDIQSCKNHLVDKERLKCYDYFVEQSTNNKISLGPSSQAHYWQGSGNFATPVFHMDGNWEFSWESDEHFSAQVFEKDDKNNSHQPSHMVADKEKSGRGFIIFPKKGDFFIVIKGGNNWHARVNRLLD